METTKSAMRQSTNTSRYISTMPRYSHKKKVLMQLEQELRVRRQLEVSRVGDSDDSDFEDTYVIHDYITNLIEEAHRSISLRRYLFRKKYRKGFAATTFERDLREDDDQDGTPPWLTDDKFLQKYRMHRDSFKTVLSLIQNHPVFMKKYRRKQTPVSYQLLVFLFYIGKAGSGASYPQCRQTFGIGRGTCKFFIDRVCKAIHSLRERVISWPNRQEQLQIARRFRDKYDFINVIAVADGTLFPLTYAPESKDAPDYHGRKHQYSLTTMIVNDDRKRIRYY